MTLNFTVIAPSTPDNYYFQWQMVHECVEWFNDPSPPNVTVSVTPPTPLTNHGGPVLTSAHVVFIFWGPTFNDMASPDNAYARTIQNFRNQFGTTPEYNTITQYGVRALTYLSAGTPDWFDNSTPPTQRHRLHRPRRGQCLFHDSDSSDSCFRPQRNL